MEKKKEVKVISITASCGGQGCRTHEKVIPWLIKKDLKKVA